MIPRTIQYGDKKCQLTGLMTFDEVDQSDQLFDPEMMQLNDKLKVANTDKERMPLAIQIRKATMEQRNFLKEIFKKYVQMSPKDRKELSYPEAFVLYQMIYQASTEVSENLKLPSDAGSGSDSTPNKTPSTFLDGS